ncbi:MAG: DUF4465 domain-containing protein [Mediterranea sp.]|jgi:hypothetical protein|nr:DUF4465 domain-containing protein [Mediterranea sp.]
MRTRNYAWALLALTLTLGGCGKDNPGDEDIIGGDTDPVYVTLGFDARLTAPETEFIAEGTPGSTAFEQTSFKDPLGIVSFSHYYADWGSGYSFAGFTYMNKTDNQTWNSPAPISGKAYSGTSYLALDSTTGEYGTPATLTILEPIYTISEAWITNSTYAYTSMLKGDGNSRPFAKGDWYKVTATGYDADGTKVGETSIFLADYKTDTDRPVSDWVKFDLTPLRNATTITFVPSSSDNGEWGMNTPAYFCLDDITLYERHPAR